MSGVIVVPLVVGVFAALLAAELAGLIAAVARAIARDAARKFEGDERDRFEEEYEANVNAKIAVGRVLSALRLAIYTWIKAGARAKDYRGEGTGQASMLEYVSGSAPVRRVLILSAAVGEGHDSAARVLADQIESSPEPTSVTVIDGVAAIGPLLRPLVEDGYRTERRPFCWVYGVTYWMVEHVFVVGWLVRRVLCVFGGSSLAREIARHKPDVIVSTYPAVTVVLARLRRKGVLTAKTRTMAMITDLAGLHFWAQPGIDMHLVIFSESVEIVEKMVGRDRVRLVRPLAAAEYLRPRSAIEARPALGLCEDGRVVAMSCCGWPVDELTIAVRELLHVGELTSIVCLTECDEHLAVYLRSTFTSEPTVHVLGHTDLMPEVLAAADALVHSNGEVDWMGALAAGTPVVSYGVPAGRARVNALVMAHLDILRVAKDAGELRGHVEATLAQSANVGTAKSAFAPTAGDVVLGAVRP
jgi:hypothetical protein